MKKIRIDCSSKVISHLPSSQRVFTFLDQNLYSPQLKEAIRTLDSVIYSAECVDLFKSFGIYDDEIFKDSKDRMIISSRGFC